MPKHSDVVNTKREWEEASKGDKEKKTNGKQGEAKWNEKESGTQQFYIVKCEKAYCKGAKM